MSDNKIKDVGKEETKDLIEQDKGAVLILKGAASFSTGGKKFDKGVPASVKDPKLVARLLASGLFEKGRQ